MVVAQAGIDPGDRPVVHVADRRFAAPVEATLWTGWRRCYYAYGSLTEEAFLHSGQFPG